jgi:malate permease and related proteins
MSGDFIYRTPRKPPVIELFQIFIDNIVPILAVAGTGFVAGRALKLNARTLGQLVFYVFSPALAFDLLYSSQIQPGELGVLFIGTISFQLIMAALSFIITRAEGTGRLEASALMISSFCLNAGNYGLSLVSFAYGEQVLARAAVVFISNLVMNYTLGVLVASSGRKSIREALTGILRVPAVYSIPAAFILKTIAPELPLVITRPIELLSGATIPCMLVLLGLQLGESVKFTKLRLVGIGVLLKMFVAPLIGVGLAFLLHLDAVSKAAFITQVSMPTAIVTLVMASEYDLDRDLSVSLILATTLISPVTLSLIIWLLRPV